MVAARTARARTAKPTPSAAPPKPARPAKAAVFSGIDGWRWRITRNGRTTATSGESFASRGNAQRALDAVIRAAAEIHAAA